MPTFILFLLVIAVFGYAMKSKKYTLAATAMFVVFLIGLYGPRLQEIWL